MEINQELERYAYSYMSGDECSLAGTKKCLEIVRGCFPLKIEDIPIRYLNLYFHLICHLGYRRSMFNQSGVITNSTGSIITNGDDETFVKDQVSKALNFLQQKSNRSALVRWAISFYAQNLYWKILNRYSKGFCSSMEAADDFADLCDLSIYCYRHPSCFVSIARCYALFMAMNHFNPHAHKYEKLRTIHTMLSEGFNLCMSRYTFGENISKADEIVHISQALQVSQYIALINGVLDEKDFSFRRPPKLPVHPKHLPFSDSVRKIFSTEQPDNPLFS